MAGAPKEASPARRNSKVEEPFEAHPLDALPFVTCPASGPRCFWDPRPSGDYGRDCSLGGVYAGALLPFIQDGDGSLLGLVVLAMLERADPQRDRGLIVGMFAELSRHLRLA